MLSVGFEPDNVHAVCSPGFLSELGAVDREGEQIKQRKLADSHRELAGGFERCVEAIERLVAEQPGRIIDDIARTADSKEVTAAINNALNAVRNENLSVGDTDEALEARAKRDDRIERAAFFSGHFERVLEDALEYKVHRTVHLREALVGKLFASFTQALASIRAREPPQLPSLAREMDRDLRNAFGAQQCPLNVESRERANLVERYVEHV
jgi:hypothetical protein